jgi:hypothetical protein
LEYSVPPSANAASWICSKLRVSSAADAEIDEELDGGFSVRGCGPGFAELVHGLLGFEDTK